MVYGIGAMCKSLAGHDKGKLFVIIGETEEYVSLVNGKSRPLEKPKQKNKKHIQIIHEQEDWWCKDLAGNSQAERITDEQIRELIRSYERRSQS